MLANREPIFETSNIKQGQMQISNHVIHCFTKCDNCGNDVHKATACSIENKKQWICDYCLQVNEVLK